MSDWIETTPENRISKDAQIESLDNIVISGYVTINRNVKISLDSPTPSSSSPILSIGKYCYIYPDVEITPSTEKMFIGSYVIIGSSSKIMAKVSGTPGVDFTIQPLHNSYKKSIELEAKQLQILNPS